MIISWNITKACQLKCRHCYRDAGTKESDELNPAEGLKLVEEIARAVVALRAIPPATPVADVPAGSLELAPAGADRR